MDLVGWTKPSTHKLFKRYAKRLSHFQIVKRTVPFFSSVLENPYPLVLCSCQHVLYLLWNSWSFGEKQAQMLHLKIPICFLHRPNFQCMAPTQTFQWRSQFDNCNLSRSLTSKSESGMILITDSAPLFSSSYASPAACGCYHAWQQNSAEDSSHIRGNLELEKAWMLKYHKYIFLILETTGELVRSG